MRLLSMLLNLLREIPRHAAMRLVTRAVEKPKRDHDPSVVAGEFEWKVLRSSERLEAVSDRFAACCLCGVPVRTDPALPPEQHYCMKCRHPERGKVEGDLRK